jgi:hypothetical protein
MNYTNTNFEEEFSGFVAADNLKDANRVLMQELGRILVKDKSDFVDLLNESGVYAGMGMSDAYLIDLFINNVGINQKLKIGTALLINVHNKTTNFDGETEINDDAVKDAYAVLFSYFNDDQIPVDEDEDEEHSNGIGDIIGGIVSKGADIGKTAMVNQRKKKYGALDDALAEKESKRQMLASVMEQRRKQQEIEQQKIAAKQKTTKTVLIIGGAVVGLGIIAAVIYAVKKNKS